LTGTLINAGAVLIGGTAGLLLGARVPERARATLMDGIGLVTVALGLQMALQTENALVVLVAILGGGLLGEWLGLEAALASLGDSLRGRIGAGAWPRFTEGFVASSVLFCVGPMTVLGAINDGLRGDYSLLAMKSVLDGFSALAFASTMGVGVLFSVATILAYQGIITVLAAQAELVLSASMVTEMTAAGGIIILGIGLRLLQVKEVRAANFLPALVLAPLLGAFA